MQVRIYDQSTMDNWYVIIGFITMLSYWQYFGGMNERCIVNIATYKHIQMPKYIYAV